MRYKTRGIEDITINQMVRYLRVAVAREGYHFKAKELLCFSKMFDLIRKYKWHLVNDKTPEKDYERYWCGLYNKSNPEEKIYDIVMYCGDGLWDIAYPYEVYKWMKLPRGK